MKKFPYITILALFPFLWSCEGERNVNQNTSVIFDYAGNYTIILMDWQAYDKSDAITVDLDDDGVGSNNLLTEMINMYSIQDMRDCILTPNKEGDKATLRLFIPVFDYYVDSYNPDKILPMISVNDIDVSLNISADESNNTIKSDKFDKLSWPDENRVGLYTFGGIQLYNAMQDHIDLTIDHYLVYDFRSSKLIDGTVKVTLIRSSNPYYWIDK